MWVVNYAAPGMAIASLGVTYYALKRKDMQLEKENQDYTAYVLDILEKTKETNSVREQAEILDLRHHHRHHHHHHHQLSLPLSACQEKEFGRLPETATASPPPLPARCRSLHVTRVPRSFNTSKTSVTSESGSGEVSEQQKGVQFVSNSVILREEKDDDEDVRLKTLSVSHTYLKTKLESFVRGSGNIEGLNVLSSRLKKHVDEHQTGGGGEQELKQVVSRATLLQPQLHTTTSFTNLFAAAGSAGSTSTSKEEKTLNELREPEPPSINSSFQLIFSGFGAKKEDDDDEYQEILYVPQTATRQQTMTKDAKSEHEFVDPEFDIIKPCPRHRQQFPPQISCCRHEQRQSQMFPDDDYMVMENPSSSPPPLPPRILNEKEKGQCRNVCGTTSATVVDEECYENDNFSDIIIMEEKLDSIIMDHIPCHPGDGKYVDNQNIISMTEATQQQLQSIDDCNWEDSDDDEDDDHFGRERRGRKTSSTITVIHNPSSSSDESSPLTCCFTNPHYYNGQSLMTEPEEKVSKNEMLQNEAHCPESNSDARLNYCHEDQEDHQVGNASDVEWGQEQLRQRRRQIVDMGQVSIGHQDAPTMSSSTCIQNPLTDLVSRSASKTRVKKKKKKGDDEGQKESFDYLHLHELAVNDILDKGGLACLYFHSDDPNVQSRQATLLRHNDNNNNNNKKNSILQLAERTQSLPDLHKDPRYGAPPSWPHCQDTTQFFQYNTAFVMPATTTGWWLKCGRIPIQFLEKNYTSRTIRILFVCLLCALILGWMCIMGQRTVESFFSSKKQKTVINVKSSAWHW